MWFCLPAQLNSTCKQCILLSQILPDISLPKHYNFRRSCLPCSKRRLGSHSDNGVSPILYTATPLCSEQSSTHLPTCTLTTFPPVRNGIFPLLLTHTSCRECGTMISRAVTCSQNFPVFVKLPKHVPRDRRASRDTEVARLAIVARTQ